MTILNINSGFLSKKFRTLIKKRYNDINKNNFLKTKKNKFKSDRINIFNFKQNNLIKNDKSLYLGTKEALHKGNISKLIGDRIYIPKTMNLTFKDNKKLLEDLKEIWISLDLNHSEMIILKPSIGNRSYGIGIVSTIKEAHCHILNTIKTYPKYIDWIIQFYIYNPMCLKGEILFPLVPSNTALKLNDIMKTHIQSDKYYKCHVRAYGILMYNKNKNSFKSYIYDNYIFNSSRVPYENINYIDNISNWSHKSGLTPGGSTPFDFEELIRFLEDTNNLNFIKPQITLKDLNDVIRPQIKIIMKDSLKSVSDGILNTCNKNTIPIYHIFAADLLIDQRKKVWFLEINKNPGIKLMPKDIIGLYKYKNNIQNFNIFKLDLYLVFRQINGKCTNKVVGMCRLTEKLFYIYKILSKKFYNLEKLKEYLKISYNKKKLINGIRRETGMNLLNEDLIDKILCTKLPPNYSEFINKYYIEYVLNSRYYWRQVFIEKILYLTTDYLPGKNRLIINSLFYNDFELLN